MYRVSYFVRTLCVPHSTPSASNSLFPLYHRQSLWLLIFVSFGYYCFYIQDERNNKKLFNSFYPSSLIYSFTRNPVEPSNDLFTVHDFRIFFIHLALNVKNISSRSQFFFPLLHPNPVELKFGWNVFKGLQIIVLD